MGARSPHLQKTAESTSARANPDFQVGSLLPPLGGLRFRPRRTLSLHHPDSLAAEPEAAHLPLPLVQFFGEPHGIQRVNPAEKLARPLCLVGLQMPHQMPGDRKIFEIIDFRRCFLHAIFTELAQARLISFTNACGGKSFGNGDQPNFLRPPSRSAAGFPDAFLDALDVFLNAHSVSLIAYCTIHVSRSPEVSLFLVAAPRSPLN